MSGETFEPDEWVTAGYSLKRVAARFCDTVLFAALGGILPIAALLATGRSLDRERVVAAVTSTILLMVVLESAWLAKIGTTFGKSMARLRVGCVDDPTAKPTFLRSFVRTVLVYLTVAAGILLTTGLNRLISIPGEIVATGIGAVPLAFGKPALHDWVTGLRAHTLSYPRQQPPPVQRDPANDPFAPRSSRPGQHRVP